MGKYMRKGKGVGKMEVSQGTLVGVRTRAKLALAMEKERVVGNVSLLHHSFSTSATTASSSKASGSSSRTHSTQPLYMELRSRKLEKGIRSGKDKGIEEAFDTPDFCKKTASSSRLLSPLSTELHLFDKERCRLWLRTGSCSMQGSDSTSQNRLPAGSPRLRMPVAPTASSNHSLGHSAVSIAQKTPIGILTRNRRQELALDVEAAMDMDKFFMSGDKRHTEVEVCCGESPMVADACNKDRDCEPSSTKRTRECTPDSFIREAEAPGSTSKTRPALQARPLPASAFVSSCEAPNANEIEAFLSSAEQRERRRFINRFNFDPLLERPLRGRYEWFNV
ncbi:hypothetical protein L7F22_059302 [Adiantum nelumboides]|nr:hypothetical protein [Adiantum nelumboides]